jgi:hypothetical protein
VTRAIKATKAAGVDIGRIEVAPDGRIVIIAAAEAPGGVGEGNSWDHV